MRAFLVMAVVLAATLAVRSQTGPSSALVVTTCGTIPAGSGYTAGNFVRLTVNPNAQICQ